MSQMIDGAFVVRREEPGKCELCGRIAETRPYGPNNEEICTRCGVMNWETTQRKIAEAMKDTDTVVDATTLPRERRTKNG